MALDEQTVAAYRAAWERWSEDLRRLHEVLLDGVPLDPLHRVALLRRESHSKERYDAARARLLGLPAEDPAGSPFPPDE
jgi:hypothetical protein